MLTYLSGNKNFGTTTQSLGFCDIQTTSQSEALHWILEKTHLGLGPHGRQGIQIKRNRDAMITTCGFPVVSLDIWMPMKIFRSLLVYVYWDEAILIWGKLLNSRVKILISENHTPNYNTHIFALPFVPVALKYFK